VTNRSSSPVYLKNGAMSLTSPRPDAFGISTAKSCRPTECRWRRSDGRYRPEQDRGAFSYSTHVSTLVISGMVLVARATASAFAATVSTQEGYWIISERLCQEENNATDLCFRPLLRTYREGRFRTVRSHWRAEGRYSRRKPADGLLETSRSESL
jgi:hypothetical protein